MVSPLLHDSSAPVLLSLQSIALYGAPPSANPLPGFLTDYSYDYSDSLTVRFGHRLF
jgi:hypothetical protein